MSALAELGGEGEGDSQEARIAWLRQRGVQIEIPGEVRSAAAGGAAAAGEDEEGESVVVVRVPADESLPYEEVTVSGVGSFRGDELPQRLRRYFSSSGREIDSELLLQTAAKQFGTQDVRISHDSLKKTAELGSVEAFALDSPSDANNLRGVSIYLDEAGQLKGLRSNPRASQLARQCGFINVPFVGDVFVGRHVIKRGQGGAVVGNESFTLKDLDSGAAWMRGAETRNYELGVSRGQVTMNPAGDEDCVAGEDSDRGVVWTESLESMEVQYSFPGGVSYTSKQFTVKFASKAVTISLKPGAPGGSPDTALELVSLKLAGSVSPDDCTWTVSGPVLSLYLEKVSPKLWQKLEVEG